MTIDPRLQILYLVGVAVGAFATSRPAWLLVLLGLQVVLWFYLGLPARALLAVFRKLVVFFTVVVISFGFFEAQAGDWVLSIPLLAWELPVSLSGIGRGLLLSTRIIAVIYASQIIQRVGDGTALVRGLRGLFVPEGIAYSLDIVLALLGGDESRRRMGEGGGRGMGGGGGRRPEGEGVEDTPHGWRAVDVLKRVLRGDVGFLVDIIHQRVAQARERAEGYGLKPEVVSDLAIVTGLAVVSMTIRALHVLPNLPVAPGHKGIVMLPLYLLAYHMTASRWGATKLGVVIGVTSFLTGEGKFGLFEIFRHIMPGLFVDLVMPLVLVLRPEPKAFAYGLVGVGAAWARLSTLLLVGLFIEVPRIFYAFLIPQIISNAVFGFLSGFVTYHLIRSADKVRSAL